MATPDHTADAAQNSTTSADATAFLWDRLGHWAQDEADWAEAEHCFRKAYDLAGGHYGYCLGTALNFLGRFEESLPILREQAERIQPDAMSWVQLGATYGDLGQSAQAIDAYEKALALDPDYDLAMFNLGGAYWNRGGRRLRPWEFGRRPSTASQITTSPRNSEVICRPSSHPTKIKQA